MSRSDRGWQFFVKSKRFDWLAKVFERIDAARPTGTGVTDEVVVASLADDDDEVGDTTGVADADDDGIAEEEIAVDEVMRGVVLVDVAGDCWRVEGGGFPVKPALGGVAVDGLDEGIELAGVEVGSVAGEDHGGGGDGAAFGAEGGIRRAEWVASPAGIVLEKLRDVVDSFDREIQSSAGRERCVHGHPIAGPQRGGDDPDEKDEGEDELKYPACGHAGKVLLERMRSMTFAFGLALLVGMTMETRADWNAEVLRAVRAMPKGGDYSVASEASRNFREAVSVGRGGLRIEPKRATPSYCSSATYLVLLKVIAEAQDAGRLRLPMAALTELAPTPQADGEGVWGRWNANGPGAASLLNTLGAGKNFTSYAEARAGDFMKIFWRDAVGKHERGHLVVYLGREMQGGLPHVRFWSSNKPGGYGEKSVPQSEIARAIFSRLDAPQNFARVVDLPRIDGYLSKLLERESSFDEACRMVDAKVSE